MCVFMQVLEGDDDLLFAHCGLLETPNHVVDSRSNELRVVFVTNDDDHFAGFNLTYQILNGRFHTLLTW